MAHNVGPGFNRSSGSTIVALRMIWLPHGSHDGDIACDIFAARLDHLDQSSWYFDQAS